MASRSWTRRDLPMPEGNVNEMTSQLIKSTNERAAFLLFVERLGTKNDWSSVSSCEPPEPDLLCVHVANGPVAFELVRITDPNIAKIQGAGTNASQTAFSTSDPSMRIVIDKLKKQYTTTNAIELLIYSEGQVITPDDVIIPTIAPWFDAIAHPFRRVWFMGEKQVLCLWNAG